MLCCKPNENVKLQYTKKQCFVEWKKEKQEILKSFAPLMKPNTILTTPKFYITAKAGIDSS